MKKKHKIFTLFLSAFLILLVMADACKAEEKNQTVNYNLPFALGEKLKFSIKYGIIKAGSAELSVEKLTVYEGRNAIVFKSTAASAKGFDYFYKVRDTVVSIVDIEKFYSLGFSKKLREGNYFYDIDAVYNQENGKAFVTKTRYYDREATRIKKKQEIILEIPTGVLDILATLYKIRTYEMEIGKPIFLTNHDNKKIYELQINILAREEVKVPAGKFKCIKVEPQLKGEALFKQKGRLWVWVTDDQYKIPVKMSSKIAVGSITTVLKKIINGPAEIPARKK